MENIFMELREYWVFESKYMAGGPRSCFYYLLEL